MEKTIVRCKRKCNSEPAETIVVSCKRSKHEELSSRDSNAKPINVLKLTGTVKSPNVEEYLTENVHAQNVLPKSNAASNVGKIRERFRKRRNESCKKQRYKLVNAHRSSFGENIEGDSSEGCGSRPKICHVYDIINEDDFDELDQEQILNQSKERISMNGVPMIRTKNDDVKKNEDGYVYDIYVLDNFTFHPDNIHEVFSVNDDGDDDDREAYREQNEADDTSDNEEEDSNDEANWRNDYPDEDEEFDKNKDYYRDYEDDDLAHMTSQFHIDDNNDKDVSVDGDDYSEERCNDLYSSWKAKVSKDLSDGESS